MSRRPVLDFWYEFSSTYSYLAAARIEALAEGAEVEVRWRPFLLGPIFAAQGWTTAPFNLYPARGRYMWRDIERQAARLGLPLVRPDPFPQNGLLAARVALSLREQGATPAFTRAVFRAEFAEGRAIADPAVILALLRELGLDAPGVMAAAQGAAVKARLRAETEEARTRGLFGAPTLLTADGEMFWGNDRLEEALAWAAGERPGGMR
ncbi:2-hydroxychromene-2-carboxylate isomerase [Chelatococcus sp. SYSU_G07232]|uniref:2-hydroxychromene-2-carboxylate isomerase n=1 Tax=Chelatococcus albus TaxID=3047466 RepID=A0ABT7AHL9_9HYPH|nr:2-hydroxychromene-2-carboxylate isomerase [Chelatococcus sp. SYSU_G07232]MDJ1158880.1 2-hydroxychromene-2-carboxylate isomerase [Chelatococcus sp. SYSU_G07232]